MVQKVKGTQATSAEAPIIIIGPHISFLDCVGGLVCGLPGVVSVIDNARIPIIGSKSEGGGSAWC